MFKKSKKIRQMDMFTDVSMILSKRKTKLLESKTSWHNVFYNEVVSQLDEDIFSVLYDKSKGRPNAPIRVLIGMMILKEGNGWSDEQLFEESRFNLKVMRALGLNNINDDVPVESTYYEFRNGLREHIEEVGEDLLKTSFAKITAKQAFKHGVRGKKIRLDSKLINSNIAKSNRLGLIVEAVRTFIKPIALDTVKKELKKIIYELLLELQSQSTSNFIYPLNGKEQKDMLITMGKVMQRLLTIYEGSNDKKYKIMQRVYDDQYKEADNEEEGKEEGSTKGIISAEKTILPKEPKEIPSTSVQSIHDPEAAYRKKGQGANTQIVSGYHTNITETCDPEDELNLITDVETVAANISEDKFLLNSVDATQQILNEANGKEAVIEEVITDGGYDSKSNRKEMLKEQRPKWSVAKMKGGRHIYIMKYNNNEHNELEVYDIKTGEQLEVSFSAKAKKYVIKQEGRSRRYFTKEEIDDYIQHQYIVDQVDEQSYNLRANVESTIHQTFHRLKKRNKTVYRSMIKSQWYALNRAFWVNVVRIVAKEVENVIVLMFWAVESIMVTHILKSKYQNMILKIYP